MAYLATLSSFRGAPNEALVRHGCSTAVVRAEGEREGRSLLVEAEITASGRGRVLVNKQRLSRARDLLGALRVSVFSPDDLELVKGGPAERRRYLDDALVARQPKLDVVRSDLDRVLRQRNALLRQSGGRVTPEVEATLDGLGHQAGRGGGGPGRRPRRAGGRPRAGAGRGLRPGRGPPGPRAGGLRGPVAGRGPGRGPGGGPDATSCGGASPWSARTATSWSSTSTACRRGPTPRRASSGRWRSPCGWPPTGWSPTPPDRRPILLLDDVFSELDPDRGAALLAHLPAGQTLLSSASGLPPGAEPELVLRVDAGAVTVSTEPLS